MQDSLVPLLKSLAVSFGSLLIYTDSDKTPHHILIICNIVLVSYDPLNNLLGIFEKVVTKRFFYSF